MWRLQTSYGMEYVETVFCHGDVYLRQTELCGGDHLLLSLSTSAHGVCMIGC